MRTVGHGGGRRSVRIDPAVIGPAAPFQFRGGLIVTVVVAERNTRVIRLDGLANSAPARPVPAAATTTISKATSSSTPAAPATPQAPVPTAAVPTLSTRPDLFLQLQLAGIGVSVVSAAPQELLFVSLGGLDVLYSDSPAQTIVEASLVRGRLRKNGAGGARCGVCACAC
jgi:hypothetical protein